MRVVVTGAAGFIGSHLSESLLADGHDVVGIDAFTDSYPRPAKEKNLEACRDHPSFHLAEGRLQDLDLRPLLEGAERVYHLAAQAGVRASWRRPARPARPASSTRRPPPSTARGRPSPSGRTRAASPSRPTA